MRPGGVLAVVTFPRMQWHDLPWGVASFVARGVANRVRGKWEHTAPQSWPPPDTYRQVRRACAEALPGAHVSRLLFGRCFISWKRKPETNLAHPHVAHDVVIQPPAQHRRAVGVVVCNTERG